jgi:hypothetical protein
MNELTPSINNEVPAVTPEIAKAKLNLALTGAEMNIQAMQTKVDTLVYNEDNLTEIKETSLAIGKIEKKIEEAFKAGKKPYKDGAYAWDAAKRDLMALISPISAKVDKEHTRLCQAVEKRRRENDAAEKKKKDTEAAINTKILSFSQEITACKTNKELLAVESRINLEKTRTLTYGDQLPTLIERCNELTELLKTQKDAVKQLEGLQKQSEQAIADGNDELLLEIEEKKEEIGGQIQEIKVRTEEKAINSSIRGYGGGGFTQTFPTVKAKRQVWKWEITDMELFAKKHPDFVQLVPRKEVLDEMLRELKEKGTVTEGTRDGLKIYLDKTY